MPNKFLNRSCVAVLALGFVAITMPAYAGFEWVAPSDGGFYQQPAPASNTPLSFNSSSTATASPEVISPVVISGQEPAPVIITGKGPSTSALEHVLIPPPTPLTETDINTPTATISVSSAINDEKVKGFASQIPLTLALRQILPSGYNFSIDQDVDMNTLVSYKGGKSWRETLKDVLAPVGLADSEQGTNVTISRAGTEKVKVSDVAPVLQPIEPPLTVSQAPYLAHPTPSTPSYATTAQESWVAQRGDTLRKVLADWCSRANVELQWQAEYDYPVEASTRFTNGFEDAVRNLLAGFESARPQPVGELHSNSTAGQMVLVVQTRGNNYSN